MIATTATHIYERYHYCDSQLWVLNFDALHNPHKYALRRALLQQHIHHLHPYEPCLRNLQRTPGLTDRHTKFFS